MTKEYFMTIQFKDEEVRRRFLDDVAMKVILTDESCEYDGDSLVTYAIPDLPYFDTDMPDTYWNYLHVWAANQVVNQGITDSKYGVNWRCYNRLLANLNAPESVLAEEASRHKAATSGAC